MDYLLLILLTTFVVGVCMSWMDRDEIVSLRRECQEANERARCASMAERRAAERERAMSLELGRLRRLNLAASRGVS